jgi:NHLM bacteriocin system ABC transporter ATP-binding protein
MNNESIPDILKSMGSPDTVGGYQFFSLNNPDIVLFIVKGSVDVFSVCFEENQPYGARSFFFSTGDGELLFGIKNNSSGNTRGLIAVPAPDTEIIQLDFIEFKKLFIRPELIDSLSSLLECWIGHISRGISKDINPRTDQLIEQGTITVVEKDLKIRSKKGLVWFEFLSGNALFLGMKEIAETGKQFLFPVSNDSWLQTIERSEIRSIKTSDFCFRKDFWSDLEYFYEIVFYCDFFNNRLNLVDEYNRLSEKAIQHADIRTSTIYKIASVINSNLQKKHIEIGQDPLVTACRLVAGSIGISVTIPKNQKSSDAPPLTLKDILRHSRFRARKVKLTERWWKHNNGPLLGFTREDKKPVALVQLSTGNYEIIHPVEKSKLPLNEKTASLLSDEAYQFYRPLPNEKMTGFKLIVFGLKNCSRDISLLLLAGLAGGLLTLLLPVLTGFIFDQVIPYSNYRQLYIYILVIFFSAFAIALFQLVRSFAMIRIETKIDFTIQSAIWDRLLNLPIPFFRNYQAGELAAKANSIMLLRKIFSNTIIYSVLGAVFMMFNFFVLFFYDLKLTLYLFVILLFSLFVIFYLGKKIQNRQVNIIHLQNKISGMMIQFLSSISKIRIAGAEIHAFAQWADKYSENKRETYETRKLFMIVSQFTTLMPLAITFIVFGVIALNFPIHLSTGQFLAFFTALIMTVVAFLQLGMAGISYFMAIPILGSLQPILETMPENVSIKPEIQNLTGQIEVSNVSFRYQANTSLVLDNVSLQVQPGEFIAIAGASGSGKSTLLRLLLGFESPESGSIYYDRQDIASIDPSSVRRQTGTVLQHSQLTTGNILSNILGMTDATFEDAWEAARKVGLDEDIRQMPMGMYTVITGGLSTLSGGQRQRILIARAIVSKPRILFLDEATSALDNKTQQIVSESLEKLQSTRIVIAHRLTTVQNADRIYMMERGRIEESGTYTELINKNGKFAELVKRQFLE